MFKHTEHWFQLLLVGLCLRGQGILHVCTPYTSQDPFQIFRKYVTLNYPSTVAKVSEDGPQSLWCMVSLDPTNYLSVIKNVIRFMK